MTQVTITNKKGNITSWVEWDNISQLMKYCEKPINRHAFSDPSSINGRQSFTLTNSFEEAMHMLQYCTWDLGFSEMRDALRKLKLDDPENKAFRIVNYLYGGIPDIPRYLNNHPMNMKRLIVTRKEQKIINMYVDISCSCGTDTKVIMSRGALVCYTIDVLEKSGFDVNLHVVEGSTSNGDKAVFCTRVHSNDEDFNLKRVVYPIAHPSMLRRTYFRAMEVTVDKSHWSCGYGRQDDDTSIEFVRTKTLQGATFFWPSVNKIHYDLEKPTDYLDKTVEYNKKEFGTSCINLYNH